ncbi:MAG: ATP-binding domain-containing protein [Chloroflexota bacterium]
MTQDTPAPAWAGGFATAGEQLAFERFRDELAPAGWTITHNLYVSRRASRGTLARELDLLLLHPRHGLVLVEVKGGRISVADGEWMRNDAPIDRDPVRQVQGALGMLRDAAADVPRLAALDFRPPVAWMLCFPDTDLTGGDLARIDGSMLLAPDQVVHRPTLRRPGGVADAVHAFLARLAASEPHRLRDDDAAPDWVDDYVTSLLPRFDLSTSLIGDLDVDRERLAADERIHHDWVVNLGAMARLHFEAGAGGGKSVIARLRARALAEEGKRVLLVCSTSGLAKSFQQEAERSMRGLVRANTLHQTLILAARATGDPAALGVPADGPPSDAQLTALPARAAEIVAACPERYDALVIDEAQDIGAELVATLTGFLHDPVGGPAWSFADAFQRLSPERNPLPDDATGAAPPIPAPPGADVIVIRQNHRNPEPVFRLAEGLRADGGRRVSRKGELSAHRIDYRPIPASGDQRAVLESVLDELAGQRIPPDRIAIVTLGRTEENPLFRERGFRGPRARFYRLGNTHLDADGRRLLVPAEELPEPDAATVLFDSARRMKGLERGAVILVDVPDPGPPGSPERRLLYAGVTRATTWLCIIATPARIAALQSIAAGRAAHPATPR